MENIGAPAAHSTSFFSNKSTQTSPPSNCTECFVYLVFNCACSEHLARDERFAWVQRISTISIICLTRRTSTFALSRGYLIARSARSGHVCGVGKFPRRGNSGHTPVGMLANCGWLCNWLIDFFSGTGFCRLTAISTQDWREETTQKINAGC